MQLRAVNRTIPGPLLIMAAIETVILFSALYVAGIAVFGNYDQYAELIGPVAPKAAIISGLILICMVAMGLYRFNQRYYFREAALRVLVGLSAGALLLALMFLVNYGLSTPAKTGILEFDTSLCYTGWNQNNFMYDQNNTSLEKSLPYKLK